MTWWIAGGAVLGLAPCVGVAVVVGLFAIHEFRGRKSSPQFALAGRRATTELLDEFLVEAEKVAAPRSRASRRVAPPSRRANPALLYELLDERAPKAELVPGRRGPAEPARTARPSRLMPLTA